jgi:glutathione S-transferase
MATTSIRLWGRRSSFHTRKAIWALNELGLEFDLTEAGFGVAPTDEFRSRNPSALAPVLDDHGVVVWESNVVVRYLYGAYGPQGGQDLRARIAAEQWMDWNATTLWPAVRPLHQAAARGAQLYRQARETREREVARWLEVLDAQLAARRYLAGAEFSMADIPAGLTADRAARLQLLDGREHVRRWWTEIVGRPTFPPE